MSDYYPENPIANPLIAEHPGDTLYRISHTTAFIQEAVTVRKNELEVGLSDPSTMGLYFIFECIRQAADYEASQAKPRDKGVGDE